jgi:signal peptidase I
MKIILYFGQCHCKGVNMRFGKTAEQQVQNKKLFRIMHIIRRVLFYTILLCFVLLYFQCGVYRVADNNDSMIPEFKPGTRVIYDRFFKYHEGGFPSFSPRYGGVKRGRAIIFTKKFDDFVYRGIGRVIALPDDTITFDENSIIVNDKNYPVEHNHPHETICVPKDSFFVLNDNLASPVNDSRHFGFIRLEEIEGVVVFSLGSFFKAFGGN